MEKTCQKTYVLEFKWTISRAKDSYGYNVCTLYVNNKKVSRCNGGGYDMQGTVLGNFVAYEFKEKLLQLKEDFYGLTFHNLNYKTPQEIVEKEKQGLSLGLERYQDFYRASNNLPSEIYNIPLINGSCGFESVESILKAIGYQFKWINYKKGIGIIEII